MKRLHRRGLLLDLRATNCISLNESVLACWAWCLCFVAFLVMFFSVKCSRLNENVSNKRKENHEGGKCVSSSFLSYFISPSSHGRIRKSACNYANLQDRAEIPRLLWRADSQMTEAATAQKLKKRSSALKDNSRQRPSKPCNYLSASSCNSWDSSPQMTM